MGEGEPKEIKGAKPMEEYAVIQKIIEIADNKKSKTEKYEVKSPEELEKIVDGINKSLSNIGIFFAIDTRRSIPQGKILDAKGEVIKEMPIDEFIEAIDKISKFLKIYLGIILERKV